MVMFSMNLRTLIRSIVGTSLLPLRYLSRSGPSEAFSKSFCEGMVAIMPPAISWSRRDISNGNRVTFSLQMLASRTSTM